MSVSLQLPHPLLGEEEYGAPYTEGMRNDLYAVMIEALGKAFCIEGFDK